MTNLIDCSVCGWRHIVPCGRDDCPHDAATHFATIATALDNAVKNGCIEELARMSDEDIAYDLARLEAGCERLPIEILKAGVRAWRSPQPDDLRSRIYEEISEVEHWISGMPGQKAGVPRLRGLRDAAAALLTRITELEQVEPDTGLSVRGEDFWIDELEYQLGRPLTPTGRDHLRTWLRAFAANVRRQGLRKSCRSRRTLHPFIRGLHDMTNEERAERLAYVATEHCASVLCSCQRLAADDIRRALDAAEQRGAGRGERVLLTHVERLVLDLQEHAKEHGWQDVDEPIAALLAWEPPQATASQTEGA